MKFKSVLRIKLRIKLFKKRKLIRSTYSSSKLRIAYILRTIDFDAGFIRIDYGNGFNNWGEYTNEKDLIWAYTNFTGEDLIKTIQEFQK